MIRKLANTIIETGLVCKDRGAETVFIGGVTVRQHEYTWERCRILNGELKEMCQQNKFIFMDNSNINHNHLCDGVHLNEEGTRILANNYLGYLYKLFGC